MKYTYRFNNGEVSVIEISDEIADAIAEMERKEKNYERKVRYHCYSLEEREEHGIEHTSTNNEIDELFTDQSKFERVRNAVSHLTPTQKMLLEELVIKGKSQTECASDLGITQGAVSQRFSVIIKKIKNFL